MSLLVWLPLNGNTNNQGLANLPNVSTNAEIVDGKLGKGYNFKSINDKLAFHKFNLKPPCSVCGWIKLDEQSTKTIRYLLCINNGKSITNACTIGIYINEDNIARIAANGGTLYFHNNSSIIEEYNKWHHFTVTIDESGVIKSYYDGAFDKTTTHSFTDYGNSYLTIGARSSAISGDNSTAWTHNMDGCIQDVRVYDHCLSDKEVAEIAKGLICHYKLDNGGFGGENIIGFSAPYTNSISSEGVWATNNSKTGTSTNYWNWTSSIVDCPEAPCGKAARATIAELRSETGTWGGGLGFRTYPSTQTTLENGEIYTLSGYIRSNKEGMLVLFCNEQMTSRSTNITLSTEWQKFTYTCEVDTTRTVWGNVMYVNQGFKNCQLGDYIEAHSLKLEKGSKATPWSPHPNDSLYSVLNIDSTKETDVSGFGNHGTKVGTFEYSSDTPRYNVSTVFDGINNEISTPVSQTTLGNNWTISVWGKGDSSEIARKMGIIGKHYNGYTGLGMPQIGNNTQNTVIADGTNWGATSYKATIAYDTWNHYVMTYNNNVINIYLNGVLDHTVTSVFKPAAENIIIGETYNNDGKENRHWKGNISDVRIYATALTAEQVKELYNTSASVDKNGNLFCYEMEEQ